MRQFFRRLNLFAIAAVLFLAAMVVLSWPTAPTAAYDWIITLGVAAIVSAIFSVRTDRV